MKRMSLSLAALFAVLALALPAFADCTETNKKLVTKFFELAFTEGKLVEASEKYVSATTNIQPVPAKSSNTNTMF